MKFKKIMSIALIALLIQTSAFASVLGGENMAFSEIEIAEGTTLFSNSFYSDQSGVGAQTENYVEYKPNSTAVPVLVNDWYLYGRRTVSQMSNALLASGLYPVMLMNSDFFSFQTGVPMSNQVCDGEIITKDSAITDAVGINADGTAFISSIKINIGIKVGENTVSIDNYNKYRQPYVIYMLDDKFSDTTQTPDSGINVVIGSLSGKVSLGETVTGKVESVIKSDGSVDIPKGKIVLTADNRVPENVLNDINLFKEGDEITITASAEGDERWYSTKYILGCTGGRLIKDGVIRDVDQVAAPRTAFGIKKDGTLIFYTIDGHQNGYSYGVRLHTLSERLKELGCVDAVNLDGGGSTSIGAIYPGNDVFSVINRPSGGYLTKVASFLGIYNTAPKTGEAKKLNIYPYSGRYLSGATQNFSVLASDSGYYKAPVPEGVTFTAPDGSTSSDSNVKITGDGNVKVKATAGGAEGEVTVTSYKTPDRISIRNQDSGTSVNSISISCKDSVNLTAYAYVGHKALISDDSCFKWKCTGNIGTVDTNGYFTAGDTNAEGYIEVSAGEKTEKVKVTVSAGKDAYTDISFERKDGGLLEISFLNTKGVGLSEENVIIRADGQRVDTKLSDGKANIVFGDNLFHKISVNIKNNASLESCAYYTYEGEPYRNIFADTSDNWARDVISYMNCYGIVNGFEQNGKTVFNPNANVTRAEFAVMVANMNGTDSSAYASKKLNFSDASSIPDWAANHIKALSEMGIMQGRQSDDKILFAPYEPLTRAEAATVLSRITAGGVRVEKAPFADREDIPPWAIGAFDKLYTLSVLTGYSDKTVKPLNTITRAEAIKLLYGIY